jgi:hypothetical protein
MNEYHTNCMRGSGILFKMELVEGKEDTPTQCDPSEFNEKGKTVWFIAVFDKANYVGRLMLLVILDSGFCVFYKGLTWQ